MTMINGVFRARSAVRRVLWWVGAPVVAVVVLLTASRDVVPAWQAHSGSGVHGTFVAQREECGRRSCTWHGAFAADDGSVTRPDVILASGGGTVAAGEQVAAVDTGSRHSVYPVGGGTDWMLTSGLLVVGVGVLVAWLVGVARWLGRRSAGRDAEPLAAGAGPATGARRHRS